MVVLSGSSNSKAVQRAVAWSAPEGELVERNLIVGDDRRRPADDVRGRLEHDLARGISVDGDARPLGEVEQRVRLAKRPEP